jgi:hypothetical protein
MDGREAEELAEPERASHSERAASALLGGVRNIRLEGLR